MTLFDAAPSPPARAAPDVAVPATPPPVVVIEELSCLLTGCTRPLDAHIVTQAALWNAQHPVPVTRKKKRKSK